MAELDRRYAQGTAVGREVAIDQGLRAYMIRVYNYMASGVAITGAVAWLIYSMSVVQGATGLELTPFGQFMFASAFKWVVIFAPLAMVFFLSARIGSLSLSAAQISFWIFAALMGASISSIFLTPSPRAARTPARTTRAAARRERGGGGRARRRGRR